MDKITWHYFNNAPYQEVLNKQHQLRQKLSEDKVGPQVLIGTHQPVITAGKRGKEDDLKISKEKLKKLGISIFKIDRGGQLTYHGPGQIVTYPIFKLPRYRLKVKDFVNLLEETMLKTVAEFGLKATRQKGHPGIFYQDKKLGSLGIHLQRGISTHGTALNICPELNHFNYLNPCGLASEKITSLAEILAQKIEIDRAIALNRAIFDTIFSCVMMEK